MSESLWGLSPTAWIALLTVALLLTAIVQVCVYAIQAGYMRQGLTQTKTASEAAKLSADAVMFAERASVAISHTPPGIEISDIAITGAGEEEFGGWRDVTFHFEIKNHGNTPASITDICMAHFIGPPPQIPSPPTGPGTGERLFLVKGDTVVDARDFRLRNVDANQLGLTLRLWMLGYVDYIDAFGIRRRSGYGRYYDPTIDQEGRYFNSQTGFDDQRFNRRNNLPFVTEPGYNYDRERRKGEGNDWSEPA